MLRSRKRHWPMQGYGWIEKAWERWARSVRGMTIYFQGMVGAREREAAGERSAQPLCLRRRTISYRCFSTSSDGIWLYCSNRSLVGWLMSGG